MYVGDEVTLVSPLGDLGPMGVMPRTRRFRVAAIFFTGMYEFDASDVYVTVSEAQSYFATDDKVSMIDVKTEDAERVELQRLTSLLSLGGGLGLSARLGRLDRGLGLRRALRLGGPSLGLGGLLSLASKHRVLLLQVALI